MTSNINTDKDDDYFQVINALQNYFEGLYEGSIQKMQNIFHPFCQLAAIQEENIRILDMDTYYKTVEQRPSPQSLGHPCIGSVLSISINSNTASVSANTARLPRIYTDYLHLLKIKNKWWIVAKTYSWETISEEAIKELKKNP